MKKTLLILTAFLTATSLYASEFEELDKPPEGAHAGQMLLGGFISIGIPFGDLIDAENSFIKNNYYTFDEEGTTKELLLNHTAFDMGISFEYMPIDHIGIKTKLSYATVIQRTAFSSEYRNWNKTIFSNYGFFIGPSVHLTSRKQWDVSLTPLIGYFIGKYEATPVASSLVEGYDNDGTRNISGIAYGADLNLTVYFSGGLYLSLGGEYTYYPISFDKTYSLTQPTASPGNGLTYTTDSGGVLQAINLSISVGYAFSN